jgi:biotin synthase
MNAITIDQVRHDWTREEVLELFERPFMDLLFEAQTIHRRFHTANEVQLSQLLSIKTGGCQEDCAYCPQAAKFAKDTGLKASRLMGLDEVLTAAAEAKKAGASRFCMGAAWTRPKDRDLDDIVEMVEGVGALGLQTCMTLGMLEDYQAKRLADAGLDYYNHNLDTSPEYYKDIITTRTFEERLDTLEHVRAAGINVCSGGIVGMGESREDRAGMIVALATLPQHPQSVPINRLVRVKGTPLAEVKEIEGLEFVRTIAVARITMPKSTVRLSAGRETMSDELQALCFMAGAASVFRGEKLLTTPNPGEDRDNALFKSLGLTAA